MPKVRERLRDVAGLAGIVAITAGAGMIYRPAGFIVGGILLVVLAIYDAWAN